MYVDHNLNYICLNWCWGRAVAHLVEALRYYGTSRVRFPMVSLEFFLDIIVSVALWPWGRLSL
jgi:hypothetical protein